MQHLTASTFAERKALFPPKRPPRLRVETDTVHTEEGTSYQVSQYYRKNHPLLVGVSYGDGPIEWITPAPRKLAEPKIAGVLRRSTGTPGGEPSAKLLGVEHIPMGKHGAPRTQSTLEPPPSIEALQAQVRWLAEKVAASEQETPPPVEQPSSLPVEPSRVRLRRRGGR